MRDIEQKIREVNGTMAMEGMPLTKADKENLRVVLRGDVSLKEMRKRILADYQPHKEEENVKAILTDKFSHKNAKPPGPKDTGGQTGILTFSLIIVHGNRFFNNVTSVYDTKTLYIAII